MAASEADPGPPAFFVADGERPEPTGAGLTDTMLLDELGPLGRAAQTLLIAERG